MQANFIQKLSNANSLENAGEIIQKEIMRLKAQGYTIGFVIGKITPLGGETLGENKEKLKKLTGEIGQLVALEKIAVLSSAVIPDHLENPQSIQAFYELFENIVTQYAEVIYTTEGWQESKGAAKEVQLAKEKGYPVWEYKQGRLEKLNS